MTYNQCTLRRHNTERIGWIPSIFAKTNDTIKLRINGIWEDGWKVITVSSPVAAEIVEGRSRDWKKQRKASDLPGGTFAKD